MIRWNLGLALVLALAIPATAAAQDEDGGGDGSTGEGEGEGDPNIHREDDEDTSQWSYEGEKVEEAKKEEVQKKDDLPPEPPADGIAGAWYEVTVDCPACPTVVGQNLGVEEPLVMRRYFDQMVIDPDRKGGKIIYVNEGQNRPIVVLEEKGDRLLVAQYTVNEGQRKTAIYATVWDFQVLLDNRLLYGRKYNVLAFGEGAWATWEKGYRADPAYMSEKEIYTYVNLSPVRELSIEKPSFDIGEKARVEFLGMSAWVRSDFSKEAYTQLQARLQAEIEAEKKRLADQKKYLEEGDRLYAAKDYEGARAAYEKAKELGLDTVDLHFGLALALHVLKRYEEAAAEYQVVIERDPKHVDARFNLGLIYEKQNKLREALEQFQAVTRLDPDDDKAKAKAYDIALRLAGG